MGRPKLDIDENEIEKLAKLGCNYTEIANWFGCNETTIRNRFSEIIAKGRSHRKAKLREFQWRAAEAGNVTMLIWLGKQELGQMDSIENINREGPAVDAKKVRDTVQEIQGNGKANKEG